METKSLVYLALAAGAGYAACYVMKAAPAMKAVEIAVETFNAYAKEYPDTRHVFDKTSQKGTMGLSDIVSPHDGQRVLGAYRAMTAYQNLRKPTYALYKKYGVQIHGDANQGYSLSPARRADALLYAGGYSVKKGDVPVNIAD